MAIPFLGAFEINTRAWGYNMCPFFKTIGQKKHISPLGEFSKRLHDHSFTSIFFYLPFNLHQTCLKLCVGLGAGA
jgi:hypothetical protein